MAKKKYYEDQKMMKRAGNMINNDMSAPCLLPREIIDKEWPKVANYNMGYMKDLFGGVQKQMNEDYADLKRETSPGKY